MQRNLWWLALASRMESFRESLPQVAESRAAYQRSQVIALPARWAESIAFDEAHADRVTKHSLELDQSTKYHELGVDAGFYSKWLDCSMTLAVS